MSTGDPIKAIEQINREYLELREQESPEYLLGRRLTHLRQSLPFHVFGWLRACRRGRQAQRKIDSISRYVTREEREYPEARSIPGARGVTYTCITGGYDDPLEPVLLSEGMDYVLFTDRPAPEGASAWSRRAITGVEAREGSNLANRYYKFHPYELFAGYDYAIYVDGNVQIVSDVAPLYSIAREASSGIAMHRHFARDCAYKDALWCEYSHRGNLEAIRRQTERYRAEGFPERFGLCEATIIAVDLKNERGREIFRLWREEFERTGSGRDQISFPYILWKNGCTIDDIGSLGNDEYHNPKFRINAHRGKLF